MPSIKLVLTSKYLAFSFCLVTVYADGGICLDILQNRWSPTYDVSAILTSIQVGGLSFVNLCLLTVDSGF